MSSFIHLLEALTVLLVGGLIFQLYRCYQNYYAAINAKSSGLQLKEAQRQSLSVQINIRNHPQSSSLNRANFESPSNELPIITVDNEETANNEVAKTADEKNSNSGKFVEPGKHDRRNNTHASEQALNVSVNNAILSGYIDEFFTETAAPNIDEFKAVETAQAKEIDSKPGSIEAFSSNYCGDKLSEDDDLLAKASLEELSQTMAELENENNNVGIGVSASDDLTFGESDIPVLNDFIQASNEAPELDEVIVVERNSINPEVVQASVQGSNQALHFGDSNGAVNDECSAVSESSSNDSDEDMIIVVDEVASDEGDKSDNVMSDRVVHAMLDEAKLACTS